ncbi:hypothetical protein CASFOL_029116 [Castilleja foliolosa]|uniref:Glycine-rich protein n=1 Tax=Castilleja foliolosa TaxID=1961234 RepID=A0ABD3CDU7_9LAMI
MKSNFLILLLSFVLISAAVSLAARPEPDQKRASQKGDDGAGMGGGFGPGYGFNIPGFGPGVGGGYGSGFGGPNGGHSKSGIVRNSVVCKEKGPCYKKKLICPAKCFTAYGRSGKGFGYGGGGGSCTIDCKKCTASC